MKKVQKAYRKTVVEIKYIIHAYCIVSDSGMRAVLGRGGGR